MRASNVNNNNNTIDKHFQLFKEMLKLFSTCNSSVIINMSLQNFHSLTQYLFTQMLSSTIYVENKLYYVKLLHKKWNMFNGWNVAELLVSYGLIDIKY